ncbi:MAG: UDP-N-acetylglucosamine 1-carboxyvinyltransferase [Candidatus Andersenbacteria bacterium RIFCSPHIGHO2_02_FULL_45_11]|uniref:UDP-N-acetylglucosamine 1-carboxyvinyltransferase n=1 Tax=Candidatus Andersenbacteria bacterium RIFCSPHIGHO2_12_FULL_45_11 TaxID=1797281 RepID=A0A1G1X0X3_9BACT|nr:MAG: UDP-N-acetylglucosamine 1-carboxyvinyltransferase [Candidatus Andersenbacteria bacterium RIFCSPHIGHO2_01_FULL_46_36]OGY32403.1 MAG: UDP-N-acetylglucosamine 1-carboxyvinyltransferase [Candidatus Andersenbacteria bacterium RIFCSPHIGHO2_02_FULL_45_11]OGY33662.1 MAG: UDP-N-acetylglucosamine 1-carboxyvinyltransferase [Candidatus Andersenbacteria bacterium RIFCSPHIGHO2_12_FULL_45_11]
MHLEIHGPSRLSGEIPVYGSKNAALPLLAASLLTPETVVLTNMPKIRDVDSMNAILASLGAQVSHTGDVVRITASDIHSKSISVEAIGLLRGSILLFGALLGRDKFVSLPLPGGDIIGARPIDVHLDGFIQLGAQVTSDADMVTVDGSSMKAGLVVLKEFSVTATENLLLACATLPGTTTIHIAAAEPHVIALCQMLRGMGAEIVGEGTHTITITGTPQLGGVEFTNIPDMLEAGFFILLAAASKSELTVTGVPVQDLLLFFKRCDDIGIKYTISGDSVRVLPSTLSSFAIQALPYPGIATDLQAPFAVIATQAAGSSLIHDPMYEGRFKHVAELVKMGANAVVCDPHRVIINGPTALVGRRIPSLDIRSGATLVMAGLIAQGTTIIDQAEIIERGYANLVDRLTAVGASIAAHE